MTGIGYMTPIITGPSSGALMYVRPPLLTLDAFSLIMHWNPCVFMGIKLQGFCDPPTCEQRNRILKAAEDAYDMMAAQLTNRGYSMLDTSSTLQSAAPYFDLSGFHAQTITETEYTATVIYPESSVWLRCDDIATISVEINPLDTEECETFLDATILFPACKCKRFGVEFCTPPAVASGILTATAKAYNFLDLDSNDSSEPDASATYLTEVVMLVRTVKPSVPVAYWPVNDCSCLTGERVNCVDPCCTYQTAEGCLIERRHNIWDAIKFTAPCSCCYNKPVKYSLDVVRDGVWQPFWADAVVSLMNTLIPADICSCNPATNSRYWDDNGEGEKWRGTYRYSYWNPFGIAAPGAQKAWKTIEMAMSNTIAWSA